MHSVHIFALEHKLQFYKDEQDKHDGLSPVTL